MSKVNTMEGRHGITVDGISPDDALCIGKANAVGTAITSLPLVLIPL